MEKKNVELNVEGLDEVAGGSMIPRFGHGGKNTKVDNHVKPVTEKVTEVWKATESQQGPQNDSMVNKGINW